MMIPIDVDSFITATRLAPERVELQDDEGIHLGIVPSRSVTLMDGILGNLHNNVVVQAAHRGLGSLVLKRPRPRPRGASWVSFAERERRWVLALQEDGREAAPSVCRWASWVSAGARSCWVLEFARNAIEIAPGAVSRASEQVPRLAPLLEGGPDTVPQKGPAEKRPGAAPSPEVVVKTSAKKQNLVTYLVS